MTGRDVLAGALALIEAPERWLGGGIVFPHSVATAARADGAPTWWGDPRAAAWCLGGAMLRACDAPASIGELPDPAVLDDDDGAPWRHDAALTQAKETVNAVAGVDYEQFNDTWPHPAVIAAVRSAIARLEGRRA